MQASKIDATLKTMLTQATGRNVEAVVTVKTGDHDSAFDTATQLLDRVKIATGEAPKQVNILRNIGAIVLAAKPTFIKKLLAQPEVVAASANKKSENIRIEPRRRRAVAVS